MDTLTIGPIRMGGQVIAESLKLKISDTVMLLSMRNRGKLLLERAVLLPHDHTCSGCNYALECVQPGCEMPREATCSKCVADSVIKGMEARDV